MKQLKHIVNWVVWTILGLYAALMIAVRVPWVQQEIGSKVADLVGRELGTKVAVGRVDLGFLNRLILDDVIIYDQQGLQLLNVARMTARVDLAQLAIGRTVVSSAQVFGARFLLYKANAQSPANYQFVLDALASTDTLDSKPLDLRVGSFIMRNSAVKYDQWDVPTTPDRFNPSHVNVAAISAHVVLKALTDDSLSLNVKRLTCVEQSGINVRRLSFRLAAGNSGARLRQFQLQLPATDIQIDSIDADYDRQRLAETLRLRGAIDRTRITPSDFRSLLPRLKNYQHTLALTTDFNYQDGRLDIGRLKAATDQGDVSIVANGYYQRSSQGKPLWQLQVDDLAVASETIDYISKSIVSLPEPLLRLGNVRLKGSFLGDAQGTLNAEADVVTDIGQAATRFSLTADRQFAGRIATDGIDVGRLAGVDKLGLVALAVDANGTIGREVAANGRVERIDFDGNTYSNIDLDATYATNQLSGWLQIDDPRLSARAELDLKATTVNDAVGVVSLHKLRLPEKDYELDYLRLESGYNDGTHFVTLNSDFASAALSGEFDYATLAQSVANAIGSKLPTLPGLPPYRPSNNNFSLRLALGKTDWLSKLLGVELDIHEPVQLEAVVNDRAKQITLDLDAPSFAYGSSRYQGGRLHITSPRDTLFLDAALSTLSDDGLQYDFSADGNAADNNLSVALSWNNHDTVKPLSGILNITSSLYRNIDDKSEAHVNILPSTMVIDNSTWQIEPSDILYSTDRLLVDHFSIHNGSQYVMVDGTASRQPTDSIVVSLKDVEVAYILDLVQFDAVTFSGKASGRAFLTSVFDDPDASANLTVGDFKFQDGRMGTLVATVDWNKQAQQIDIHATANDGLEAKTYINGYVSPEREYIDLGITADGTYLDFMHSFTESFISDITGHGKGNLRLAGPLDAINLTGGLHIDGRATITPLNTTYTLSNDSLTFVYNEILIDSVRLHDKHQGVGYLSGAIHHQDLTNLSLDLRVDTQRLLAYDFDSFMQPADNAHPEAGLEESSFYGTIFAAGSVDIAMHGDDVRIDCDVTPLSGSTFVYNAAQNDAISDQGFITWRTRAAETSEDDDHAQQEQSSNIYMNFLINATPEGTLRLLMDAKTGDYITLYGSGTLQASYYNKGTFQMQGTYTVDHGTYDITIQQIINKKFQFQPGGTIVFGGDPYLAALNLQALYTVNGVSLSDLQLGDSFSSNTVRVNCLMNIGGQPAAPQVTFDLDMPNVNADEKQMVRSLLSSQQEMNQQVLYLLGIGRFYTLGQNNADQQPGQQDQTTLAMQSFLSGTLSTQINNVLNQVIGSEKWNFGANISTGTEGWNNAEYEGTVAGRMLDNRLLINGQFGYRDNATQATPSFIGDFDIQYLLLPSGNLALKVYNQTNDRYFTRSSLNTQGIGIIMKKDFNGLRDFFGHKSR